MTKVRDRFGGTGKFTGWLILRCNRLRLGTGLVAG